MLAHQRHARAVLLALAVAGHALDNGFGRTPVMGFNTYNAIGCTINETWVASTMRAMSSMGFIDAGYKFWQLDCGWQGYQRGSNGALTYDADTFPNGIAPLSQLATSLGAEWSMYTDQGVYSCDTNLNPHRPGSLGYEKQDAAQFAEWNVSYVKVDNCFVNADTGSDHSASTDFVTRYGAISDALQSAGIKGIEVCQWGVPYQTNSGLQGPAQWTPQLATSFRIADDITQGWGSVIRIMNQAISANLRNLNGPGAFADMDLLEVGNPGMTQDEQASHFAIWAMFKSVLMISTVLEDLPVETAAILKNKGLIDINQDPLGAPVTLVQRFNNDHDLFDGPLTNGDRAVLLVDSSNAAHTLRLDFRDLGITSADVTNLWTGETMTEASSYSAQVNAHGSLPLQLTNVQRASVTSPKLNYYEGESGQLAGGARTTSCSGCSGGSRAAFIGNGGSLTISNISTSMETQDVRFDYLVCAVNFAFVDQGANAQGASISVNGGPAQSMLFPLTGYNWDVDVAKSFFVRLSGFSTTGPNTLTITAFDGNTQYAPDIDRIGVVA